ncbi:hypothetical protein Hdeb2414_s0038g00733981 [Helianthus debilis subsp. tardiflorus]
MDETENPTSGHRRRRPYGPSPTVCTHLRCQDLSVDSNIARRPKMEKQAPSPTGLQAVGDGSQILTTRFCSFGGLERSKRVGGSSIRELHFSLSLKLHLGAIYHYSSPTIPSIILSITRIKNNSSSSSRFETLAPRIPQSINSLIPSPSPIIQIHNLHPSIHLQASQ